MKIGVIIPTLNEESFIGCTLEKLQERGEAELVVVVDCGSEDKTTNIVHMKGEKVIGGNHLNCRSAALNEGAMWILHHNPKIDVLWFLHADIIPPKDRDQTIKTVLADPCVIAGAFDFQWDLDGIPWKSRLLLHIISLNNRMRFRITRSYFGDQALFVRSNAFLTIRGISRHQPNGRCYHMSPA